MRIRTSVLLRAARADRSAIGAFNVYTLDQAMGVLDGAERCAAPVILQVHPGGVRDLTVPLLGALASLAQASAAVAAVHLDHCSDEGLLGAAIQLGVDSIMADGSELDFEANVGFVRRMVGLAGERSVDVEGELGRLAGAEDGHTVEAREGKLTDPDQAAEFVSRTGVAALAVCIGNVHGRGAAEPRIDLRRLDRIARSCPVPLVLHGASGLPAATLREIVMRGVAKVNFNTELRSAYLAALREGPNLELAAVLQRGRDAVAGVAQGIMVELGSGGLASRTDLEAAAQR